MYVVDIRLTNPTTRTAASSTTPTRSPTPKLQIRPAITPTTAAPATPPM
jgi:hypothetical protein